MSEVKDVAASVRSPRTESFNFGPWTITSVKGHILKSQQLERYHQELELPQLPEMLFGDNVLKILNTGGYGMEFNALDSMKRVDAHNAPFKVAAAQKWQEARSDCEFINKVVKPFDWTYTTDYKGTLLGNLQESPTDQRIDMEKLKVREKIHFYEEMTLFEDELADNGSASLTVKMRVMQSCFFILLRFFLRVDDVLIRIHDTRIYHEAGESYILREFTSREKSISDLKVEPSLYTNPTEIAEHLDITAEQYDRIDFPQADSEMT
ncbi:TIP41-like protein [Patiria miniata]|uniref:TIP41-like protein n=1 Tax=Patiria miniata TaxID=46514 RepID=A0A913Z8J9_PATMI|nr:TIP41-like protein [Patiria miniata]XP_038048068.1 TIP41-like protein [Patiria miniata]